MHNTSFSILILGSKVWIFVGPQEETEGKIDPQKVSNLTPLLQPLKNPIQLPHWNHGDHTRPSLSIIHCISLPIPKPLIYIPSKRSRNNLPIKKRLTQPSQFILSFYWPNLKLPEHFLAKNTRNPLIKTTTALTPFTYDPFLPIPKPSRHPETLPIKKNPLTRDRIS